MEKYDSYSLIRLGLWLRYLQKPEKLVMESVRDGVKIILEELENFRFNVSKSGAFSLELFIEKYSDIDDNELVGDVRGKELSTLMSNLENIIFAEAQIKFHYVTTERRYNLEYLLETPEKLFADGVFHSLPDICIYDFTEGFKCISYEIPTAAAFHMLRATEGVLKGLYFTFIKQKRVKIPMWGNMLNQLKEKTRNKPSKSLLEALNNIKESYRNPTNHPEAVYTISQAEDLMGLCIDVANKMHHAIQENA